MSMLGKLVLVLLILACAGAWYFWPDKKSTSGSDKAALAGTFTVKKGDLQILLTERGTLKTKKSQHVKVESRGSQTIEWLIAEGTEVKEGDILVELDRTASERRLEELDGRKSALISDQKAASTELLIQEEQNKTDIEKAELQVEVANVTLQKLLEGDIPLKLREFNLKISRAKSDLKRAEEKYKAMPKMLEQGFITDDQFEQERIALETAQNTLESAVLTKSLYEKFEKPLNLKQKNAAVREAQRALERTQKKAEARIEAKTSVLRQKDLRVADIKIKYEEAEKILTKLTLKAPTSGIVLHGNPDRPWESEDLKVGSNVWNNATLITIPDHSEMAVVIQVHEADIEKVKVGLSAKVSSETVRGISFDGKITKISSIANAGRRRGGDGVRRFRVEIEVSSKGENLRPGTSAQVELQLGEVSDVLYVPKQCLHLEEGEYYCFRQSSNGPERVDLKLGRSSENYVEVKSGIKEGDEILLYRPDDSLIPETKKEAAEKTTPAVTSTTSPGA